MFEYFGLVAVVLNWIVGGTIIFRWRGSKTMTISQHAASARPAFILFGIVLSIVGPLFYLWVYRYVAVPLELGPVFVLMLIASLILQFVTGLIPDSTGWRSRVHRATAYTMAFLFLPLSVMILLASPTWSLAFWAGLLCVGYMIGMWFLYWFVPKAKDNYLIFQALYVAIFQLQILAAGYTL